MMLSPDKTKKNAQWLRNREPKGRAEIEVAVSLKKNAEDWLQDLRLPINADQWIAWIKERRIPIDTFLTSPMVRTLPKSLVEELIARREEVL